VEEGAKRQVGFGRRALRCYNGKRSLWMGIFPIAFKQGGLRMFSLFEFAIGVRLLMFIVFVACVYGGNLIFTYLEHRKTKFLWKLAFVTLYSIFLLLVTYVVWLVFHFGLNV